MEPDDLLRHARDAFLALPADALTQERIRSRLALDPDPDAFEDADRCELALEIAQAAVAITAGHAVSGAVGERLRSAGWMPDRGDLELALAATAKLGAPGSELDLLHEADGADAYAAWKGELGMLAADARRLILGG